MRIVEKLGQQPRRRLLLQMVLFLAIIFVVDLLTTWQFNMFVFYCMPIYIVGLYFSRRTALSFALLCLVLATAANADSIAIRGWGGYSWTAVNRTCGFLMAVAFGISFQQYREETQRRFAALQRSQELEREVVRAGEIERKKIGQDLHDGVCQTLAALDCAAQCLKLDLESQQSPLAAMATQIQQQLSNATLEARNMARGIYPVSLTGETFPFALKELAATNAQLFGSTVDVFCDEEFPVSDPETTLHLYRITQEALSNAARHANATRIEVRAQRRGDHLVLAVTDDGCGSAFEKTADGMGYHTMRYRANLIGAQFRATSQPGQGTTIECDLPITVTPVAVAAV